MPRPLATMLILGCAALANGWLFMAKILPTLTPGQPPGYKALYSAGAATRPVAWTIDHNPDAFTCFLTGAGVKRGFSYGASDQFGFKAEENPTSVYDFNATLLHLMGLDHERLTFYHNGLERRLTNVHGHVIPDLLT